MKTSIFQFKLFLLLPTLLFFLYHPIQAQSIVEGLGGAPTNLMIYSRDVEQLDVAVQCLIRRGVSSTDAEPMLEYASAHANEQIHWELLTRGDIQTINHKKPYGKDERYYEFKFYDEGGELIYFARVMERGVRRIQYKDSPYVAYSFNFNALPIVIFEHAKKLKLEYIHKSRKH